MTVSAALDGAHAETTLEIHGPKVTSFSLGGPSVLRQGESSLLQTLAHYDDGTVSTLDLSGPSSHLAYASSDVGVIRFHGIGEAVGVTLGSALVTATLDGKVIATGQVRVSNAALQSISITPPSLSVTYPAAGQLTVTATYADGNTSDVTSAAEWIASETNLLIAGGALTVTGAGTSTVRAIVGEKSAVSQVTVAAGTPSAIGIEFDGALTALPIGASAALVTWANYASGKRIALNELATWHIADPTIAIAVGSPVRLNALKAGSTTVEIALDGSSSAPVTLNVTRSVAQAIHFADEAPFVVLGQSRQLYLNADFDDGSRHEIWSPATFTVTNPRIAAFGNTPATAGVVSGLAAGQTSLRATALGFSATAVLSVVP